MSFVISPGVIQTPLTAGGVAYGTGTVAKVTSAGTAGQFLQSSGASPPIWAAVSGGFSTAQVFTSSGTFTVPSSGKFKVTIIGGGGGGGSPSGSNQLKSGGGGGATVIKWYTGVSVGTSCTVTIGSGGAAGTSGSAGSPGGSSSFTGSGVTTLTANGGSGGTNSQLTSASASGGDINIDGGLPPAYIGYVSSNSSLFFPGPPGAGGSLFGFGGEHGQSNVPAGTSASGYGGGGGAGGYNNNTGVGGSGGAGTNGICIVEY